jgi:uncharacterized protein YutE (UPF0331/DUF86 family)
MKYMLTARQITEQCDIWNIESKVFSTNNIYATSKPFHSFDTPLDKDDLEAIGFPPHIATHVVDIGVIVNNLISQQKRGYIAKGSMAHYLERAIKIAMDAQNHWFEEARMVAEFAPASLELYMGKVFKTDPEKMKAMEELNQISAEVHLDYLNMSGRSGMGDLTPLTATTNLVTIQNTTL